MALPIDESKAVIKFVKKHIITRFKNPRVIIRDGGHTLLTIDS